MQKRKEERDQQLKAFNASRSASGVDSAASAGAVGGVPGDNDFRSKFVAGTEDPNAAMDKLEHAQQMRQSLTLQLRQTLTSTVQTETIGEKLDQLEQMKSTR